MKRRILALVAVLALVGALVPATVFAATTGMVTCTVSAFLISVMVTDGNVAYGALEVGANKSTLGSELNDTQTAINDGTVAEDFSIKSSQADGTKVWELVTGTPGSNQFKHEFSTDVGSNWSAMTTSYTSLATNKAPAATQTFDLKITMPSSTDDYLEHTITVTVLATQHS